MDRKLSVLYYIGPNYKSDPYYIGSESSSDSYIIGDFNSVRPILLRTRGKYRKKTILFGTGIQSVAGLNIVKRL